MFWIKFCLIVLIIFVLISIVQLLLRNLLKIDKGLRTFSAITLITLSYVLLFYYEDLIYLIFVAVIFFMTLDYLVRAFFEWKYTQYPKQSILTLTEILLILIAIIIVFEFQLLGPLLS